MHKITFSKFPPYNYARNEAINMLCTNLSFSGENVKKIMITSCHVGEGKSTIAFALLRKIAELHNTVILVDADLRKSVMISEYGFVFDDSKELGLAHYLSAKASLEEVLYSTSIEGAYMIPVGRTVSNPLRLLNTDRFQNLLTKLSQMADYVLIDAPPIGPVIDGVEIAKYCDGTLIVVESNGVHRRELQDVKYQLEKSGCPILGVALNKVNYTDYTNKQYYNKGYYYYKNNEYGKNEANPDRRHGRHKERTK